MRVLALSVLLAGLAHAEPRLRTFIGGTSSGGAFTDGRYLTGAFGVAADVGVQLSRDRAFSAELRASTSGFQSWFQLAPSVEWSSGPYSVGLGVGAALMLTFTPRAHVDPYVAVPFHFGLTLDENPAGSMRVNVEVAFVWNPMNHSAGALLGFSLGRQSR